MKKLVSLLLSVCFAISAFTLPTSAADNLITPEQAILTYKRYNRMNFEYLDCCSDGGYVFPAFFVTGSCFGVNAKTGEKLTAADIYDGYYAKNYDPRYDGIICETGGVLQHFPEEEAHSVAAKNGLIPLSQAYALVDKHFKTYDAEETYASLNEKYNDNWVWEITYCKENSRGISEGIYSAEIDAKNNSVISIYDHQESKTSPSQKEISENKALSTAKAILGDYEGENASNLSFSSKKFYDDGDCYFTFIRIVNGLPCYSNYVWVNLDKYGNLKGYTKNWYYDETTFPDIDGAITKAEAYDKLLEAAPPKLEYKNIKGVITPVYTFRSSFIYLDKHGSPIYRNGEPADDLCIQRFGRP